MHHPHAPVPLTSRIGLGCDQLLATTWSASAPPRYVAQATGLRVLAGEVVAVAGSGASRVADEVLAATPGAVPLDAPGAAASGTLRIHAVAAARVGAPLLVATGPLDHTALAGESAALVAADLASLAGLGLATVVVVSDPAWAALFADRVVLVEGDRGVGYPVLAPRPRAPGDVAAVVDRLRARALP